MKNNIFIWGSKSKALIINKVIANYKKELNLSLSNIKSNLKIKYIFDPYNTKPNFKSNAVFSNKINDLKKFLKNSNHFIVCIGSNFGKARYYISRELEKLKCKPLSVINKYSFLDSTSTLGKGIIVMPNVTLHCYSKVGDYCILNTSATIEHECIIGHGTHIMGGACVAGRVKIGKRCFIAPNSVIDVGCEIGEDCLIGTSSLVRYSFPKNSVIIGSPAKRIRKNI